MQRTSRGTRRASGIALMGCLLLLSAAETGGALAPPCAHAMPLITTGPSPTKPIGDPDTPDEGGGKTINSASLAVAGSPAATSATATSPTIPERSTGGLHWFAWIRSIARLFHLE
jgi:hypothetical protein